MRRKEQVTATIGSDVMSGVRLLATETGSSRSHVIDAALRTNEGVRQAMDRVEQQDKQGVTA